MRPAPRTRTLGERFDLVAPLGAGAMGEVYRAHDRMRGEDVALKILPTLDAAGLLRFKNEFRALHDIRHPNLVRLDELYEDRGTWFFTMQLVEGTDVLTWTGRDLAKLRRVLPQIARALHRLHDDGLVHRDVKPTNVLVTPAGAAMVLDFGLVAPTWSPGEGAGTPAFMAPEQVGGDITPATDWYALGTLVFRMLTGRLPFVGSAEDVMRAKNERPAPRVSELAPSAPADLAALVDALLARRPQDRPSGDAVLAALGSGAEPTHHARNIIVGRERELAELRRAVADRMNGDPLSIAVVGESGLGKTTLLRAFAEETEQSGQWWVLRGRCWERESVPYKGLDGVIDELAARIEAEDLTLPDNGWLAILAQAFPVLRRLPAFAQLARFGEIGGHETVVRLSVGVRWLLTEVAARQPLVIVIDDLQWADRDTLALVRALVEPPVPNVLLAVGAREPVTIDGRAEMRTLTLAPLTATETTTLVEMIVSELGGTTDISAIAREAGGHPLFAAELARHAVATGEVRAITFEDAVRQLIARLGPAAAHLATVIGLAHAPLSFDVAARAAGQSGPAFFDALAALRDAQLLATTGVGTGRRLEPAHDRIRGALTAHLSAELRTAMHGELALAFEASDQADPATLALHWHAAGDRAAAARHAQRAAEQAEAALAFHRASRLYTWAVELDPTLPNVRVRQAESLAQAGLGVAAAEAFLACAATTTGAEAIDLRRRAMQQLLLMGHNVRALALLDELMRELGVPNPTRPALMLVGLARRRASIRLRRPELPPPSAEATSPLERARLDVIWDAAAGLALLDPLRAFYLHSVNLERCLRAGDSSRLARALMGEAPYLAASARPTRRLETVLGLADEAAVRAAFPALTELARGTRAFFFGEWDECHTRLARCEQLLAQDRPRLVREGFGPAQLQDLTRRLDLVALVYRGELRVVAQRVAELLADALQRNDLNAATHLRTGVQALVHLAFGDIDTALRHADEGIEPWRDARIGIPHFMDAQARSLVDIYRDAGEAAHDRLVAAWRGFVRAGLLRVSYLQSTLLDLRGRAALAAAHAAMAAQRRRKLLDDARWCIRRLTGAQTAWAQALAEGLRGGVALAAGDDTVAREHIAHAAQRFAAADMRLHAANMRLIAAELAQDSATATEAARVLSTAGVADVPRYSRLLLPR